MAGSNKYKGTGLITAVNYNCKRVYSTGLGRIFIFASSNGTDLKVPLATSTGANVIKLFTVVIYKYS